MGKEKYKIIDKNGKKVYEKSFCKIFTDVKSKVLDIKDIPMISNLAIGFQIDPAKEYILIEGYANNKLNPENGDIAVDSYGDFPIGDNVYDLTRLKSNPVLLVDHNNSASNIAGNFIYLAEDSQGLKFRAILRPLDEVKNNIVAEAISSFSNGWGKALSIGGRWYYDKEKSKPEEGMWALVSAELHEISLVAVGADKFATIDRIIDVIGDEGKGELVDELELAIGDYLKSCDDDDYKKIEDLLKGDR